MKKNTRTLMWLAGGAAVAYLALRPRSGGLSGLLKVPDAFNRFGLSLRTFDFAALRAMSPTYQQAFADRFAELLTPADVVTTTLVASYVCGVDETSDQCRLSKRVLEQKVKDANAPPAVIRELLDKHSLSPSVASVLENTITLRLLK